ncbi:hypothetical protein NliqN6_5117 [Naganishia liquefaciens]|uniref:Uncharacterized protein n=1 Tax=Naganishia liquefaciens TaxID=104408 RepID=A0A8H3TWW8_9TREE|nr:hypothetical protein NliqN6_5117 [Naganishia liquefaciens]
MASSISESNQVYLDDAERSSPRTVKLRSATSAQTFEEIYHDSRNLRHRGTLVDRARFLRDLRGFVASLPHQEHQKVLHMLRNRQDCDDLVGVSRDLAFGLKYSEDDLDSSKGGLERYVRGFYFQAAHSEAGIIIGKFALSDSVPVSDTTSTVQTPIVDNFMKQNFGHTTTPTEEIENAQRGILFLEPVCLDDFTPLWTLPANDSFVLGAIHFGRDIHLASPRKPSDLFCHKVGGRLSVFGRELAVILSSGAYELHCSALMGETFKFVGTEEKVTYNIPEIMNAIHEMD